MPKVDVIFPLRGESIAIDHAYALYSAVSAAPRMDWFHDAADVGMFSIRGTSAGDGRLSLDERSRLRLRVPETRVRDVLPLAGKSLRLGGDRLAVCVPSLAPLVPAARLHAAFVLIKIARQLATASEPGRAKLDPSRTEARPLARDLREHTSGADLSPERFLQAAIRQLTDSADDAPAASPRSDEDSSTGLGFSAQVEASIPLILTGPHAGEPRRRALRIKDQTHVGYSLLVEGLSAEESIRLQEQGLGGRRKLGCGLFLPWRGDE